MSRMFYMKLAAENIKKNSKTYVPYMITCIGSVAMYYIMYSLAKNTGLYEVFGGYELTEILTLGTWVLALFCVIFLFYTNSFLVKRRKKEFGLFNIMGMEKRHIAKILGYETVYVTLICLIIGIVAGILFSQLFYMILLKLVKIQVSMQFQISFAALRATIILFAVIFLMTFLNSLRQIHLANPIELLMGEKTGEREPKTKWVMTIIGLLCLGTGYYIAVTAESPLEVILLFLFAIIMVMIGTYCLFTAGSITLLKSLKKNKKYYYQTKHFTSVSGLIYRMKQNAVGLSNICILSTGILLMVSAAISLYVGIDDVMGTRYPSEFMIEMNQVSDESMESMVQAVDEACDALGLSRTDVEHEQAWLVKAIQSGSSFTKQVENENVTYLYFIPLSEYNRITGENETLKENEVLLSVLYGEIPDDTIQFGDENYTVKGRYQDDESSFSIGVVTEMYYFVVPDFDSMEHIFGLLGKNKESLSRFSYNYNFNTESSMEVQTALYDEIFNRATELSGSYDGVRYNIQSREASRLDCYTLYGGMFFVGIFMGVVFLMATVLIIYYKQISEGYDDSERFKIMKKVGMSRSEIRKSIHSQVLTVFFIPLGMACIHMCFAFPIMRRLMALLNLTNVALYAVGCVATVLVFAVIYGMVYIMTARIYYRIVSKA